MAQLKLTENELRLVVRKIIAESKKKITEDIGATPEQVEVRLNTPEGFEFTIKGEVYAYEPDEEYPNGSFDVGDYSLVDGSYEPEYKGDIEDFILNNEQEIEQELVDQVKQNDQYAEDEPNEYDPDSFRY